MASELKVDKFTGVTTAGSILVTGEGNSTTTNLQQGLNKVWCAADENSTVVVRDSFNIASLTDNSAGDTSFSFTSAMSNTGFSGVSMASGEGSTASYDVQTEISDSRTSSLFRSLSVNYNNGARNDSEFKSIQICGDLA
jgi:hypothetical protein